jgi:hypothetical protein
MGLRHRTYCWSSEMECVWRTRESFCSVEFLLCGGCKESNLVWFLRYMNILRVPGVIVGIYEGQPMAHGFGSVRGKPLAKCICTICLSDSLNSVHISSATCYRSWYCLKAVHKRTGS